MKASRLSAFDAFFVAYQESSGVSMQLGVEVELKGRITLQEVEGVLRQLVRRWPQLGQTLRRGLFGLAWAGECRTSEMLHVADNRDALAAWRNKPLDPFAEPPLQLMWIAEAGDRHLFAFRAHHAVVDGEGFMAVCAEAIRALVLYTDFTDASGSAFKRLRVREAVRSVQRMRRGLREKRGARLEVRSYVPGDTATVEREIGGSQFREVQRRADRLGLAPGWLCASAWMRAIHAWNVSRAVDSPSLVSLEVPVSLRRRRDRHVQMGNWISPLTLYGDATHSLEDLATQLKQQMTAELRRRTHLALPMLSKPAKFLPWPIFRKLAANPELTGSATSHFAWFDHSQALHDDVFRISGGALQLVGQRIYTPVCLHMGAALAVLAWPNRAQVFLTYRLTALSTAGAQTLLNSTVEELSSTEVSRQRVAV